MIATLRNAFPLMTAALLTVAPLAAHAETVQFHGTFAAEGQSQSKATGKVTGTFDTETDTVTYKLAYSGLSGDVVAAHFHGPADAGQDAGVLLPIPAPYMDGMSGSLHADEAAAKALMDGRTYLNLHTKMFPGGEIRAQIAIDRPEGGMKSTY